MTREHPLSWLNDLWVGKWMVASLKLFEILEVAVSYPCPEPMPQALVSAADGVSVGALAAVFETCTHHSPGRLQVAWPLFLGAPTLLGEGEEASLGSGRGWPSSPSTTLVLPPV